MSKLFYRGPSLEMLHEQYAKRGRTDDRAPVRANQSIHIETDPKMVWEVLAAISDWPSIDSAISNVDLQGVADVDRRFTWKNGRSVVSSRFAVVDPCRELTWTGVSAGVTAVHRHILHPIRGGATRLETEESMAAPLLPLVYGTAKLNQALSHWLRGIKVAAEQRLASPRPMPVLCDPTLTAQ